MLGWGDGLARPDQQDADREKLKQWREIGDNGRAPSAGIVEPRGRRAQKQDRERVTALTPGLGFTAVLRSA